MIETNRPLKGIIEAVFELFVTGVYDKLYALVPGKELVANYQYVLWHHN
jgi:hypothetical protein